MVSCALIGAKCLVGGWFGAGAKCSEVAQSAATRRRPRQQAAGCQGQAAREEDDVRVTTAFNRLLRLPGAAVIDVSFTGEGVIVTVRLRRRRRVCSRCGQTGRHPAPA